MWYHFGCPPLALHFLNFIDFLVHNFSPSSLLLLNIVGQSNIPQVPFQLWLNANDKSMTSTQQQRNMVQLNMVIRFKFVKWFTDHNVINRQWTDCWYCVISPCSNTETFWASTGMFPQEFIISFKALMNVNSIKMHCYQGKIWAAKMKNNIGLHF